MLFWTCIHCNGPNESTVVSRFDGWNYVGAEELPWDKKGVICDENDVLKTMEVYFTPYFQTLMTWVNRFAEGSIPEWRAVEDAKSGTIFLDKGDSSRASKGPGGMGGRIVLYRSIL